MPKSANEDDIRNLLELHGLTAEVGGGFWISFKVRQVEQSPERPYGIQYSLTLHKPGNDRIVGYDNAHRPKIGTGPASASRSRAHAFDHRHFKGHVTPYRFEGPGKLLEDFWADVETILREEKIP